MPSFVSSFHPGVDYNASAEYHVKIEDFLARLDAKDPGAGKDLIFRVVKQERAFKGRAIFEALCRHYPGLVPIPEPVEDPDAEYVSVSALMAELAASHPRQRYDDYFGHPLPRETRTPDTIYQLIVDAEEAMLSESEAQATITAQTLKLLENALDVAIEDRDSGRRR